jgi:tetratricopeptide (TPR) repeat protein
MNTENMKKLGKRIPLIGRDKETEALRKYLYAPGSGRHYVYFWARGGLGKTRLLEELERMVEEAGPRFYFSGIIDLYHTDTHSTSDLERIIVEGLDPEQRYFAEYRQERKTYELLRERGTDPGILEERRQKLGDLFVKGCREMALNADKLVICFDTIELLQYESSVVEEKAGLDIADTRVKPWLLDKLAQLSNVLVVFVGRPKLPVQGETIDPQTRLVTDMGAAFGKDLSVIELKPFSFDETQTFLQYFEDAAEQELVPAKYAKIIYRLTGGRPIFLHLIVDWLAVLALESRTILQMFDQYIDLADADEGDKRLEAARRDVERGILNAMFNDSGEIGGYLTNIALIPKGVDVDILNVALGLPKEEATQLLDNLEPLSFIKRYKSPPGIESVRGEQLFLHDEVYRLLTLRDVLPYLRMNERRIANTLVQNYYNARIATLEQQLAQSAIEQRLPLREQLQKLQVERVYYLLVADPSQGYAEYKRLTDQANRHRWVGFSMRLLDEFLRFYNAIIPDRRKLFEEIGIAHELILRESAWMWIERFYWWGQNQRLIQLAEHILQQPETFCIFCSTEAIKCSVEDLALVGNIYAFWAYAYSKLYGYAPSVVEKLQTILKRFPTLEDCTPEQAVALARLLNACGYQFRLAGRLNQATEYYSLAKAAFRSLESLLTLYLEEYAMLLNNLAFAYAKLGRMILARPLAHEALRLNEEQGNEYSTGLTLSTLSQIARMRENYDQAMKYGQEALTIFHELGDIRGIALARQGIAQAKRAKAKHEFEKRRSSSTEEVQQLLEEARSDLNAAQEAVAGTGITALDSQLLAEQGRVSREFGRIIHQEEGAKKAMQYFSQSVQLLQLAARDERWSVDEKADALQDLAETQFDLGDHRAALASLENIEALIGTEYLIIPGEQIPNPGLPSQHFEPLGKMEMLRGQMAFALGNWQDGLRHNVLAYTYFMRFSADAVKKTTMVEYLYRHLQILPVEQQQEILRGTYAWINDSKLSDTGIELLQAIGELFGIKSEVEN